MVCQRYFDYLISLYGLFRFSLLINSLIHSSFPIVKPNSSSSGDLKDFLFQGMYQEEEKLWKRVVKLCTSPSYGSSSTANQGFSQFNLKNL